MIKIQASCFSNRVYYYFRTVCLLHQYRAQTL